MIDVYGRKTSMNVQMVMWGIAELQLDHVRHDVGGAFGGTDTAEFRAMNPNGVVPVVRDGDVVVFESGACLRYLAARYGHDHFWPQDPGARAELDKWADWAKVTVTGALTAVFVQLVRTKTADRNAGVLAANVAALARLMPMLDARIGAGPWLKGANPTSADVGVGSILYRYYTLPFERAKTPHLDAHYARLSEHPPFAEHVMISYESLRVAE